MNLYSSNHCLKYSLNAIRWWGCPMLVKMQHLRGHVLFFWDTNDSKSLGNWFPTIQGNALHLQHSSSSHASIPFEKALYSFETSGTDHPAMQQHTSENDYTTTKTSRIISFTTCCKWGVRKEGTHWCHSIKLLCAWKDVLRVTAKICISNLFPVFPINLLQKSYQFICTHHKFHQFQKTCCKNRRKCYHTHQ